MMNATTKPRRAIIASAIVMVIAGSLWATPATAQMFKEPFSFGPRSAASMAVFMRQMDESGGNSAAAFVGGDPGQTLVCAGTGPTSSTSAGNIMCVLAGDNTNVLVDSDQDSEGDMTSSAQTNQTAADEIGSILTGDTNGDQ